MTGRYVRQERFDPLGEAGQSRLGESQVLVCGCGALGSMIAERLARAGVGKIRIVDRDWVELSNLQRQCLFTEKHARESTPKAVAAVEQLKLINSVIGLEPIVDDISCENIERLANGCDLLLDGTDNFETRFLINDFCVKTSTPWVHAGCLGAAGQVLTIQPGKTACFRCLVPNLPSHENTETCDSVGVLGTAIGVVASFQAGEALKLLSGNLVAACSDLVAFDLWYNDLRKLKLKRNSNCPTCALHQFPFLDGDIRTRTSVLCGKNAVQIVSPEAGNMEGIARKLRAFGEVVESAYFVRLKLPSHTLTIFRGGRTIVEGTTDESEAKTILSQTVGS